MLLFNIAPAHASTAQNGIIPSSFREGYYSAGAETTYLTTKANYTERGTSLDFDDEYGFSVIQTLIYGRFDFTNEFSTFLEVPLNFAMSENPTNKFEAFNLAGISVGANYDLNLLSFSIIPEFRGYFAVEKYDQSSDNVLTSDGVNYFDIGSHLFKTFSNFKLHGFLSYQHRMEGFSSLLNYQADLTYALESASFAFGARGFESITDDEDTDTPALKNSFLDTVNGSSRLFGSVNPSRLDLFAQVKVTLGDAIDLYGGVNKSIRGENSADLLSFTVGFEYFFEPLYTAERVKHKETIEPEGFSYDEEKIDPIVEEKIQNYNKPVKKIKPKKVAPPARKTAPPRVKKAYVRPVQKSGLQISKKQLGKKTTSTSPIKSKPKSKKTKRVRIDF